MKRNAANLEPLRASLRELCEMARLEQSCTDNSATRKVWHEVGDWAEATAERHHVDIDPIYPAGQPRTTALATERGARINQRSATAQPDSSTNHPTP